MTWTKISTHISKNWLKHINLTSSGSSFLMGFNLSVEPTFEIAPWMANKISFFSSTSTQSLVQSISNPSCAASKRYSTTVCSFIGADLPGQFYKGRYKLCTSNMTMVQKTFVINIKEIIQQLSELKDPLHATFSKLQTLQESTFFGCWLLDKVFLLK